MCGSSFMGNQLLGRYSTKFVREFTRVTRILPTSWWESYLEMLISYFYSILGLDTIRMSALPATPLRGGTGPVGNRRSIGWP